MAALLHIVRHRTGTNEAAQIGVRLTLVSVLFLITFRATLAEEFAPAALQKASRCVSRRWSAESSPRRASPSATRGSRCCSHRGWTENT